MHRCLTVTVAALALCAAPASAASVSGWYAGIYGGAGTAGDVAYGLDTVTAILDGPGPVETPDGIVNAGVDPVTFDFLNQGLGLYPYAADGMARSVQLDGRLDLAPAPVVGAVVGYGFGNGLRIEADLSATGYASGDVRFDAALIQMIEGGLDGSDWVWETVYETGPGGGGPPPSMRLEDLGLSWRSEAQFLLVNAFYDFDTGTPLTPYIGGGVGAARITATLTDQCDCFDTATASAIVPAAQLGGGVRVALGAPVALDVGYRYRVAGDADLRALMVGDMGGGIFTGFAGEQSGLIGIDSLTAGLTFALQ